MCSATERSSEALLGPRQTVVLSNLQMLLLLLPCQSLLVLSHLNSVFLVFSRFENILHFHHGCLHFRQCVRGMVYQVQLDVISILRNLGFNSRVYLDQIGYIPSIKEWPKKSALCSWCPNWVVDANDHHHGLPIQGKTEPLQQLAYNSTWGVLSLVIRLSWSTLSNAMLTSKSESSVNVWCQQHNRRHR